MNLALREGKSIWFRRLLPDGTVEKGKGRGVRCDWEPSRYYKYGDNMYMYGNVPAIDEDIIDKLILLGVAEVIDSKGYIFPITAFRQGIHFPGHGKQKHA